MEVRRTLPVKLLVADSDRDVLLETIDQYRHCATETSDHRWDEDEYKKTAKYAVKDELYHDLKTEHDFECQKCGYENHADYNAGKNVAVRCCRRLLRRNQTGGGGGAPVDVALNGGTMTVAV